MAPLSLLGDTLGQKHKHFNKLVDDAAQCKDFNLTKINSDDDDVDNLLKIDTACKIRNVDYIIDTLKCEDMLYVSRAIKHSTWLITEQEYAHIINPEFLYTQLFPYMLTKAINKLLLSIRLHMKDEKRVEAFYLYLKEVTKAHKWLLNCSIPFIENVLHNERNISLPLYKGLCKRSIKFLPYYTKVDNRNDWRTFKAVLFLIHDNAEEFLNVLETSKYYSLPPFGKKCTEIIMKQCPNRILDNFEKYVGCVDVAVFAKYMKKETIIDFVIKHASNTNIRYFFVNYENLKHFIKNMPTESRFEFVKNAYIDRNEMIPRSSECMLASYDESACLSPPTIKSYQWYQYAPFDVALTELTKLIRAENSPAERCAMILVLMSCVRANLQHTKTLLQYYYDKHRNEPFKFKIQFVNKVISQTRFHELDNEAWNILDTLFHSMEVYIESNNDVKNCLKSIVLYKVLHNENIPEIVEKKLEFDTFKKFQNKLKEDQRNKIFSYLLSSVLTKIQNKEIANEKDFEEAYNLLKNALNLLIDWKKDIKEYSIIREKVRDLLKIKKDNSWNKENNLSELYSMNKSWRRHLFEESIMMSPTEEVFVNALKHGPHLLQRHCDEVDALRTNDSVSLRRFLAKLRVYWTHSIAQEWIDAYLNNIKKETGHKSLINGIFVLLPQNQLVDIAKKYVPKDSKIEWASIDTIELSLSKNIAKSLYIARPQLSLDVVLWYCKGDYLQYAVPSLSAMLHNLSKAQSRKHISKFLEAPVSLQKYGLHLAFIKLKYEELKPIFSEIWKTSKNITIKTCLFTYTYNALCKVKEPSVAKELWGLLSLFIDNLPTEENKTIFKKLGQVTKVHISVQGEVFIKSYTYLASLPAGANGESYKQNLINNALNLMHLLDMDFVADKIIAPVEEKISKPRSEFIDLMSSFVLHGKTEDEQCERFRRVIVPAMEYAVSSWNMIKEQEYVMKVNIDALLRTLTFDSRKLYTVNKIIIPVKLFSEIKTFMEQKMPIGENYVRYTTWKLIYNYMKLVAEHKNILNDPKLDNILLSECNFSCLPEEAESVWETLHVKISPQLGPIIVEILKEDTENYFPTICWAFSNAIQNMFSYLAYPHNATKLETLKYMILNEDFIPSYLVVCAEVPKYGDESDSKIRVEIRRILAAHSSMEVQIHYQRALADVWESAS